VVIAAAAPANYFELSFDAEAGRPYHLWIRGKADGSSYANDSVHVQFSDSVLPSGQPIWRIGSTSSTEWNLEECSNCGEAAWGWEDNGWGGFDVLGPSVFFATSGRHTIRVQQREDGVAIDQIVISSARYASTRPGAAKNDATIVPR
jgi:hypothetical protein